MSRYSIVILRPVARWYAFIASKTSATGHLWFTGISRFRTSSSGEWRLSARWIGSFSSASS